MTYPRPVNKFNDLQADRYSIYEKKVDEIENGRVVEDSWILLYACFF